MSFLVAVYSRHIAALVILEHMRLATASTGSSVAMIAVWNGRLWPWYTLHYESLRRMKPVRSLNLDFFLIRWSMYVSSKDVEAGNFTRCGATDGCITYSQILLQNLTEHVRTHMPASRHGTKLRAGLTFAPALRPFYWELFGALIESTRIRSHTHWGWYDQDLVLGRLPPVLASSLRDGADIITILPEVGALWLAGQLSLFRVDAGPLYNYCTAWFDLFAAAHIPALRQLEETCFSHNVITRSNTSVAFVREIGPADDRVGATLHSDGKLFSRSESAVRSRQPKCECLPGAGVEALRTRPCDLPWRSGSPAVCYTKQQTGPNGLALCGAVYLRTRTGHFEVATSGRACRGAPGAQSHADQRELLLWHFGHSKSCWKESLDGTRLPKGEKWDLKGKRC